MNVCLQPISLYLIQRTDSICQSKFIQFVYKSEGLSTVPEDAEGVKLHVQPLVEPRHSGMRCPSKKTARNWRYEAQMPLQNQFLELLSVL